MKLAVVSDLHFGDDNCVLVEQGDTAWRLNKGVENRLGFLANLDVLILLGDIFDLSIASYEKAFAASRPFFELVVKLGVKKIVYVPGNHDTMVWHALEYETRITRPLAAEGRAQSFRASLPAIIRAAAGTVELPGVSGKLGDVFLSKFTKTPVVVAYPNAYIVAPAPAPTVLLSHGQYLEGYWALGGELVHELAVDDLRLGPNLSVRQVVELNHPLSQLSSTGIGQAGALTGLAREVQREVKDHRTGSGSKTDKYLSRLQTKLDTVLAFKGFWAWLKEVGSDKALGFAFERIRGELGQVAKARCDGSWLFRKDVRQRFEAYYQACLAEVDWINRQPGQEHVPAPTAVVLGHTHTPEPWSFSFGRISNIPVEVANTGGWLEKTSAQVILFDGTTFASRPVFGREEA